MRLSLLLGLFSVLLVAGCRWIDMNPEFGCPDASSDSHSYIDASPSVNGGLYDTRKDQQDAQRAIQNQR